MLAALNRPCTLGFPLGGDWFWSYAPALVGDDFRPLSGPDPGGPAYGNLLVSRLPLERVEHLRFPPAGGGEQRSARLGSLLVGSRPVTVAATHLPTSRATTSASCGSCSSWPDPGWRRGCWWAT